MSRPVISTRIEEETRIRVEQGWADFHAAVAASGPSDDHDRKVIDTVITALAMQGKPFSVNAMRELLPEVRPCMVPARLVAAQRAGLIRWVGVTASTLRSTKSAKVNVYIAARPLSTTLMKERPAS